MLCQRYNHKTTCLLILGKITSQKKIPSLMLVPELIVDLFLVKDS